MTEKRFTITQDFEEHHRQIRDNGHIIMGCFVELQAEVIVDKLNELHEENKELKDKNSQLQETLAFRSNQLTLMERLVDDLGSEEMARQMEEILND